MSEETFIPPASSHVEKAVWDSESEDLTVTYSDGSEYVALNVGRGEWRQLQSAQSTGSFLQRHFRGRLQKQ